MNARIVSWISVAAIGHSLTNSLPPGACSHDLLPIGKQSVGSRSIVLVDGASEPKMIDFGQWYAWACHAEADVARVEWRSKTSGAVLTAERAEGSSGKWWQLSYFPPESGEGSFYGVLFDQPLWDGFQSGGGFRYRNLLERAEIARRLSVQSGQVDGPPHPEWKLVLAAELAQLMDDSGDERVEVEHCQAA